jgi:hypothetical protein
MVVEKGEKKCDIFLSQDQFFVGDKKKSDVDTER